MNMGALTGSREPNPQAVSALTGFDPERRTAIDYILPRLTNEQKAFILRMEPSRLEQVINSYDWDNIDPKVDNDDPDGWPYWYWYGGMRLNWPAGRAAEGPEITFMFNEVGLAVRDALAAATGTAKTPQAVECEASQSGGEAVTPNTSRGNPSE